MATCMYTFFAPPERGGRGDFPQKVLKEAQSSGKSVPEVATEVRFWTLLRGGRTYIVVVR